MGGRRAQAMPVMPGIVIMGRLFPAGTGVEYYHAVTIAGEDVEAEKMLAEPDVMESLPGYDEEARTMYTGGAERSRCGNVGRIETPAASLSV